jgi:hypothetical protein
MMRAAKDVPALSRGRRGVSGPALAVPDLAATTGLAVAILLASATSAGAQAPRNGPEWGGKNHQPAQGEVIRREKQAGVRAPKAQVDRNKRTVQQLDRQLLHDEAVDPPTNPLPR